MLVHKKWWYGVLCIIFAFLTHYTVKHFIGYAKIDNMITLCMQRPQHMWYRMCSPSYAANLNTLAMADRPLFSHTLQTENQQLRTLLQAPPSLPATAHIGFVIRDDIAQPNVWMVRASHAYPVHTLMVDEHGMVGSVHHLMGTVHWVRLMTHPRHMVSVNMLSNHASALAVGQGARLPLRILHVPQTLPCHVGDQWVTSGLDQRYPPNIPIGSVTQCVRHPEDFFWYITLQPAAHLTNPHWVWLVT
jgi:cell shape-determining protein MreC